MEQKLKIQPLVSIVVITYNSAKYVLETLDSAKAQTYENIELIVSDDCSTDNTLEIVQDWVINNNARFKDARVVTSTVNSGISANCNRGVKESKGEWTKLIAGDDILMKDCINDFVTYSIDNNGAFFFSLPSIMTVPPNEPLKLSKEKYYKDSDWFFKLSAKKQFSDLLINDMKINPATLFCHRETLLSLGGFNEEFKCEDLPLYLKATSQGYPLLFLAKNTVIYRIHMGSMSNWGNSGLVNDFWVKENLKIKGPYTKVNLLIHFPLVFIEYWIQTGVHFLAIFFGNKKSMAKLFFILRLMSPLFLFKFWKAKLNPKLRAQ